MPPEETEPPIREFADRGTIWLLESPANLRDLVRLMAAELAERLDFSRAERINRSFIPADLYKQEADVVWRVPFLTGQGAVWIYLLIEHQTKPERDVGLKILTAMVELWQSQVRHWQDARTPARRQRLHPVIPLVFYTGSRRWKVPIGVQAMMDLPAELEEFIPTHRTLRLFLRDTSVEALDTANAAIARVLLVLKNADKPYAAIEAAIEKAVQFLESLPPEAEAEWRRAMHFLLLLIRHKRAPEERDPLFGFIQRSLAAEHREEVETMVVTDAMVLEEKGRREGRQEAQREMLRDQIVTKFNSVPEDALAALNRLTDEQARLLSRKIITAVSIEELGL